jgi:hypothetical protein
VAGVLLRQELAACRDLPDGVSELSIGCGKGLRQHYAPTDAFRVVQLTPPGSSCSIRLGIGLTDAPAGSVRNIYLVVTDLETARARLLERGVHLSEIRHKTPVGAWDVGFAPRLDADRGDYASFAEFADPDGNARVLQERGFSRRYSVIVAAKVGGADARPSGSEKGASRRATTVPGQGSLRRWSLRRKALAAASSGRLRESRPRRR